MLVVEQIETGTCQTLRSRIITTRSSLLRSDLPPVCRLHLGRWFPFIQFDQTTLTSLVPFDRLTECPAALTPDETQPVIRYRLCFYRRCKRNHLLCSSSCPFEASSNGSHSFSSPRSYLNRFICPFYPCRSAPHIFICSITRRCNNSLGKVLSKGQLTDINFLPLVK